MYNLGTRTVSVWPASLLRVEHKGCFYASLVMAYAEMYKAASLGDE